MIALKHTTDWQRHGHLIQRALLLAANISGNLLKVGLDRSNSIMRTQVREPLPGPSLRVRLDDVPRDLVEGIAVKLAALVHHVGAVVADALGNLCGQRHVAAAVLEAVCEGDGIFDGLGSALTGGGKVAMSCVSDEDGPATVASPLLESRAVDELEVDGVSAGGDFKECLGLW